MAMSGVPTGRGKCPGSTARRPWPRPNGFSLIEALVALVLISIAALALAGEISLSMASHHMGTEQSRAISLAVQKMEELKPKPAAQVVDEPQTAVNALGEEGSGPYVRWVDVVDGGAGQDTKTVRVFVEYGAGRFGRRTVDLYTIIYTGN
jgi:prepilin-type N-terminal cleavage/methylation domain-containing protein